MREKPSRALLLIDAFLFIGLVVGFLAAGVAEKAPAHVLLAVIGTWAFLYSILVALAARDSPRPPG